MALNHQLADTNDKAAKVGLMREINRLIIDDAVIIPLYHFVDVNLTDHRYKLFDDNEFTASPRLWNIRKKAPGRAKP